MPLKQQNSCLTCELRKSRCAFTRRAAVLNMCSIWLLLLVTFNLCNFYATLTPRIIGW